MCFCICMCMCMCACIYTRHNMYTVPYTEDARTHVSDLLCEMCSQQVLTSSEYAKVRESAVKCAVHECALHRTVHECTCMLVE